jgi:hypothetical protein
VKGQQGLREGCLRFRRDDRPRGPPRPRYRLGDKEKVIYKKTLNDLVGSRAACIFNDKNELLGKVPVSELESTLRTVEDPHAVIFDGKINYRLNEIANRKGVRFLVGMERDDFHSHIVVLSRKDLE